MSDYLENQLLTHVFRTASYTKPTELAIALCTSAVSDSDTGITIVEVPNSNSYARVLLEPDDSNWSSIVSGTGQTDNSVAIIFPQASGSWGTITSIAICDSATWGAGNVLFYGTLDTPETISTNNIFAIDANNLIITLT